jgi:signal peptidase I
MAPVEVPADHYFVMGDNRDDSRDSREWGFVPRNLVRGKVLLVYWSVDFPPPPEGSAGSFWQSASATFTRTRWDRTFRIIR